MTTVNPIPEGYPQVMPYLTVDGASAAIDFYTTVFGAKERLRMPAPEGKVGHAELEIGDSVVMLADAFPDMGGKAEPASLWIYTDGVDQAWKRATDAGCTVKMPLSDMFWGDRMGTVVDKWGIRWSLAQRIKEMTPVIFQVLILMAILIYAESFVLKLF